MQDTAEQLRRVYGGKRWIVALDTLVGAGLLATRLEQLGALQVFCLGASRGTGPLPPERFPQLHLGAPPAHTMMGGIRDSEAALDALPAPAEAALRDYDPAYAARVVRAFFSQGAPVGGRSTYGARRPAWQALEDKLLADELWKSCALQHAPSVVAPLADVAQLTQAMRAVVGRTESGAGCVLAGDNHSGWHGGGSLTRWARSEADLSRLREELLRECHQVRVMPFLAGVPCSIHGLVFDEPAGAEPEACVAVFRPAEMLVLKRAPTDAACSEFLYASTATCWDPPSAAREQMRSAARRLGAALLTRYDYRGAFTLDGVLTSQGFIPTELNPRVGAALANMERGLGYPLYLLSLAIIEGEARGLCADQVEAEVLASADKLRGATAGVSLSGHREGRTAEVKLCAAGARFCAPGETPDCKLELGPAPMGSMLRMHFEPALLEPGAQLGPRVADVLNLVDQAWQLGLGQVTASTLPRGSV